MNNIILNNLNSTKKLAKILASELSLYSEIYLLLDADLGIGKTTLAKLIISELKIKHNVSSPTFVILNQYKNKYYTINHVDLYRVNESENFDLFLETFENSINIIEWPDVIKRNLINKYIMELKIHLKNEIRYANLTLNFKPKSKKLIKLLHNLKKD